MNDLKGKTVLISGGTKGIGLATGLAFGRQGAICTLTHKWGSADEHEIRRLFAEAAAPPPRIVEADVRETDDTVALLERMRAECEAIECFVSGAAYAQTVDDIGDMTRRSFIQSMEYTAWPVVEYVRQIQKIFGAYPRYVVALSSPGSDEFCPRYDVVGACKAALETLCRYLAYRLQDDDVRINIVRARFVRTESLWSTVGPEFEAFVDRYDPGLFIPVEDVANAVLALCSGLMDAVNGQTLVVDRGTMLFDNLMGMYDQRFERSVLPVRGHNES